jgi:poly-gamma-glutamate capsule biosynthesis protein CapA/YwtB (metallophosphatase superfamily)
MTRIAMTGVTALTRATAYQMELNGVLYPGTEVAPVLQTADIAHVSHEVPFAPDCPYPNPVGGTTFCARDSYLALLQEIGVDVVELTGNHVNDWGAANLLHSLDLYTVAGMVYFGGGRNAAEAAEPALFEHNGNRIAFTGCNPVGPAYAWATTATAGSRPCGDDFYRQIDDLRDAGYLVVATLQYYEFYHYAATAQQQADFARVAAAGAAAVSGSQGHHAQGFAFHEGAFIHYGLGNLFFDQMDMLGTRQAFVDNYVVYDGRLLSVELWTGLIENWSRPRLMTPAERAQLLTAVFQASGWGTGE